MYTTYILKSKKDNKYYFGSTSDVNKRLKEHNSGKVKSTKSRIPFVLHYFEEYKTRSQAMKRERYFKKRSGNRFLKDNRIIWYQYGEMAERSNAAVLKTVNRASDSWVRIPLSPPVIIYQSIVLWLCQENIEIVIEARERWLSGLKQRIANPSVA